MKASALSFRAAVLFALTGMGMGMGIAMAIARDHAVTPAHAHLNLLGWVSLFLFGLYYRLNPALDVSRLALVQVGVWSVGTVVLTIAVAAIHMGYEAADPVAGVALDRARRHAAVRCPGVPAHAGHAHDLGCRAHARRVGPQRAGSSTSVRANPAGGRRTPEERACSGSMGQFSVEQLEQG